MFFKNKYLLVIRPKMVIKDILFGNTFRDIFSLCNYIKLFNLFFLKKKILFVLSVLMLAPDGQSSTTK
jgi:hypothetical protein